MCICMPIKLNQHMKTGATYSVQAKPFKETT